MRRYDPPLDAGIAAFVEALDAAGIETYESCEGGDGHAYPMPTVRFHGQRGQGWRALQIALDHAFPVAALRRAWNVIDGEATGPTWEMTFYRRANDLGG
jgi:hypothetical protein